MESEYINQKSRIFLLKTFPAIMVLCISIFAIILPIHNRINTTTLNDNHPLSQSNGDPSLNKIVKTSINPIGEIRLDDLINYPQGLYIESNDISLQRINFTYIRSTLIGTVRSASVDTMYSTQGIQICNVTIRINETVQWGYNNYTTQKIVGFQPIFQPAYLQAIYLNVSDTPVPKTNYSVITTTDLENNMNSTFYFNFESEFNNSKNGNLTITYQYDVDIPISGWQCTNISPISYITNKTQEITQEYKLEIGFGSSIKNYNMSGDFNLTIPEIDKMHTDINVSKFGNNSPATVQDFEVLSNVYKLKNVNLTNLFIVEILFKADYSIQLLNTINNQLWCEDRLVQYLEIRERDYKLSVIDGPSLYRVSNIWINETKIYYGDLVSGSSVLKSAIGRDYIVKDMKETIFENDTTLRDKTNGIYFLGKDNYEYYIVKGEIDLITIKYKANEILYLTLTDQVSMPLTNQQVKIYFMERPFGSKITDTLSNPYPLMISDNNGKITVANVPVGNFTIEILDSMGKPIENLTASSEVVNNILKTKIQHFPSVILSYTGIFASILLIGIIIFKKSQKNT